jgi:hypothetical protein
MIDRTGQDLEKLLVDVHIITPSLAHGRSVRLRDPTSLLTRRLSAPALRATPR